MADSRTYVGIDLTDAYSRARRAVDLAILDPQGGLTFAAVNWPAAINPATVAPMLEGTGSDEPGTILVVDGPQGLATPQNSCRRVETQLNAPARTPWQLPEPGQKPFAGYIRSSIEFYRALLSNVPLAELDTEDASRARLFEAYPGAAWRDLRQGLDSKATRLGRGQREQVLGALLGLYGIPGPTGLSHDQLDAALCAALGLVFFEPRDGGVRVELVGERVRRDEWGELREGRVLMPTGSVRSADRELGPPTGGPVRTPPGRRRTAAPTQPCPEGIFPCNWVYFAGPARAGAVDTYALAAQEGIIARTTRNANGGHIPNVQHLEVGDTILLAYSVHGVCTPLGIVRVTRPDPNAAVCEGMMKMEDANTCQWLDNLGYPRDPHIPGNPHTVIPVEIESDLQGLGVTFRRPTCRNALMQWEDVFLAP